jgi:hypothetical protein
MRKPAQLPLVLAVLTFCAAPIAAAEDIRLLSRPAPKSAALTQTELTSLIESMQKCWNPPSIAGGKVSVKVKLDRSGAVVGMPDTLGARPKTKRGRLLAAEAKRAVLKCQPYALPAEKYDSWREVIINFLTD